MAQVTSLDALPCTRPGTLRPSLSSPAGSCTLWDAISDTLTKSGGNNSPCCSDKGVVLARGGGGLDSC